MVAVVNLAGMGVFNGVGVVFAALSVVLLVKHGFDMGTFAAPLDLALTYYEDATRVLVGWIAPVAQRAAALAGFELSFQPHWKHFFLLTLLYCGAWTRASGGEKGSRVFDAVWGVVMALAAGLAAGLVPVAPGEFERVLVGKSQWYPVAIAEENIGRLKWLAAYVTRPTSAVTHKARVRAIKRRADGRYVVHLAGAVTRIKPIPMGSVNGGIRGPSYTDQRKLQSAKSIRDL